MINMKNKKAVSSLIAVVLLILVISIMIGVIFLSFKTTTTDQLELIENIRPQDELTCSRVYVKPLSTVYSGTELEIVLENQSDVNLEGINIAIIAKDLIDNEILINGYFLETLEKLSTKKYKLSEDFIYIEGEESYYIKEINEIIISNKTCPNKIINIDKYEQIEFVTDGLLLMLTADTIRNLENNDLIDFWLDISGNNNHATKYVDDDRPTYMINQINNKPAIYFNGENRLLLDSDLLDDQNNLSIFVVFSYEQITTFAPLLFYMLHGSWSGNYQNIMIYSTSSQISSTLANGSTYNNISSLTDIVVDEWYYVNQDWNSTHQRLYLNGTFHRQDNWTSQMPNDAVNFLIGARGLNPITNYSHLYGYISEIIIYDRSLDDNEREIVNLYLSNKYGV